jgi:hypothetical protein
MFDPDIELADLRPRPFPRRNLNRRGETARFILERLRVSPDPMTAADLARAMMIAHGLNAQDGRLLHTIRTRVGSCLRRLRDGGYVQSRTVGGVVAWETAKEDQD